MTECETYNREGLCCCECVHSAIVKKWKYQDENWRQNVCTYFYDFENGALRWKEDGHGLCECFTQKEGCDGK